MRFVTFIGLVLVGLALSVTGCEKKNPPLGVGQVVSDPGAFSGSMDVIGIAYAYSSSDPNVMGIMDLGELQCASPTCTKPLLPVRVGGTRPAIGDEVQVTGSMVKEAAGYLFKAEAVKVLARHNLGASK
jgi:predicted small secreted protein